MAGALEHPLCEKLIDQVGENLFILDKAGRVTFINSHALRAGGYSQGEILGRKFGALVAPESRPAAIRAFRDVLRGKKAPPLEVVALYKGGRRVVLELRAEPLREGGKIIGAIGATRDITSKKAAESALRESGQRLNAILSSMADLIFVFDKGCRFTYYHAPSDSLLLLPPEKFMGRKYYDVLPPHVSKLMDESCAALKSRGVAEFEYPLKIGKRNRWFYAKLSAIKKAGRFDGAVAVVREITDKVNAREQLRRQVAELEKFRKFAVGRELKMVELKKRLRAAG